MSAPPIASARRRKRRHADRTRAAPRLFGHIRELHPVAARFFVTLQRQRAFALGCFEHLVERAKAEVALAELRPAALEGLLDHRAPDLLLGTALGGQRLDRLDD